MSAIAPWRRAFDRRQRAHAKALAAPMTDIPLVGDPRLEQGDRRLHGIDPQHREICLYAAAVLVKRGVLPIDCSNLDARFSPPNLVLFTLIDVQDAEICRFNVNFGGQA